MASGHLLYLALYVCDYMYVCVCSPAAPCSQPFCMYILVTKILNVGMEKEQKQELGWRVSVLPIPAFHCILCTCNITHSGGMQEWVIQIPMFAWSVPFLPSR